MALFLLPLGSKDLNSQHQMVASTHMDTLPVLEEGSDPDDNIYRSTHLYEQEGDFNHCGLTTRES